ncbi:MAG: rRNA maturation RNase YbeY [Elusimicrobiales bacterium]|jgi:probable rRNA maturation factor
MAIVSGGNRRKPAKSRRAGEGPGRGGRPQKGAEGNLSAAVFFKSGTPGLARELSPLLKKAVLAAASGKKAGGVLNLVVVSDTEIKRLNKAFLSHAGATDVIAFNHARPAFSPPGETAPFGDIYICLPAARRQAAKMGHSLETELLILAVHGALHLSGMDDATAAQRLKMNKKTVRLLRELSYS